MPIGIQWARERAATHVLLMDQDSVPAPDMVSALLLATESSIAAVGPGYLDSRQDNPTLVVRRRGLRFQRLAWEPAIAWHLLLKFGFYSRLQHLRMMTPGPWHGLRGRAGALMPLDSTDAGIL